MTSYLVRRLKLDLSGEESWLGRLRTRKTAHLKGPDTRSLLSDLPKNFDSKGLNIIEVILGKTLQV